MTQTIARNSNKAKEVMEHARNIRCFSLGNNFSGMLMEMPFTLRVDRDTTANVSPAMWIAAMLKGAKRFTHDGNGKYSITIHSNLWYEFEA